MRVDLDPARPEIWSGVECTVNRVGDRYFDQLVWTRHDRRPEDIDRLAGLGVRAVRYPVLWERHAADPTEWDRTDDCLSRLRDLGIRPIIGLVHHGSGPPHTSLVDPAFADGLAAFAAVAERFPWVDAYAPVNEPLTTARFAGLYGHWYPHGRDDRTFVRCLLTQCRAVVLAMRAVRRSFDWGSLVTVPAGRYEAGLFDVRTDPPVETPLADLVRGLAIGRPDHPALDRPGWWERPDRLRVPPPVRRSARLLCSTL